MEETQNKPSIEKDVFIFLDSIKKNPPIYIDTYEAARATLSKLQSNQLFLEDVDRHDYDIPLKNETEIHVRIVRDKNQNYPLPMVFYIHGGGFVMGNAMIYDTLLRNLAKTVPACFVFAEYSLAPYCKYPTPLNELFEVFEYMFANAEKFNISPSHVIFAGDSVGGNMATVLTYLAQKKGYPVEAQFLFYPVTNALMDTSSYQEFNNGPWLTKEAMEWFIFAYEPDINKRKNPYVSPFFLPDEEVKNMPFTFILTAENDVLRDEGEAYAKKLLNQGVDVFSIRINGTIHDFLMLEPLSHSFTTRMSYKLITDTLKSKILNFAFQDEIKKIK